MQGSMTYLAQTARFERQVFYERCPLWISRFDAAPSMEVSYKKISIHGACVILSAFFHFVVTTFSTVMKPVVIFSLVCLNR